ncbi:ASPARTIC PROTEASE IN GUARD CELL 2-like protein [Trifolium pratense]|uniref:ASPARTIC PROTEASE IN GUARD CELL 2-like protein n=1 Tax=Trifolium pratense TaxID=57577 RepID=A0A2K3NM48_TRIPR|nr:ASPARTIC PROTEASE IN GUARD CELL 2-like protein [Trifolium pratense]
MVLILLLLSLVFLTTSTSIPTSSPSHNLSYPHFQRLNVKQTIAETKLKLKSFHTTKQPQDNENANTEYESEKSESGKQKLKLLHRDKISTFNTSRDHRSRFNARMNRDSKRVAAVVRRIAGASGYETEEFGSDVVSGMELGSGEYFVRIGVGSPPKNQYVVIDSGSDIIWVQCQPCTQCYHQSDPVFNPGDSSSYAGVSCGSTVCSRVENAGCTEGRCHYEVSYGDGSYTKGTLALETVTLGGTVIQNVAIGCGHRNQGMFVGAAGLLGLGSGPMSFVGQLGGQTGGTFSYCLVSRGTEASGTLEFGRESVPVGASWVSLIHNPRAPSFYYIGLSGLGVGGLKVPISEDVFRLNELGEGGVVMDTGTAVTRLPTAAYDAFRDAFTAQTTNLPRASRVSIFDTCYNLYGFVTVRIPTISFYFLGGPILTLPARNFLIPVDDVGTFCFAFAPSPSGLSIIGNIQQEGIEISVDGANGYVGFGPNVC